MLKRESPEERAQTNRLARETLQASLPIDIDIDVLDKLLGRLGLEYADLAVAGLEAVYRVKDEIAPYEPYPWRDELAGTAMLATFLSGAALGLGIAAARLIGERDED